jgi:hypothetical protein
MDLQQSINFAIIDAFKENHVEFAYPTQRLIFNWKDEKNYVAGKKENMPGFSRQ